MYRKPRADVYTVMLVLALFALIGGLVCLWFEMADYDFKFRGAPAVTLRDSRPADSRLAVSKDAPATSRLLPF